MIRTSGVSPASRASRSLCRPAQLTNWSPRNSSVAVVTVTASGRDAMPTILWPSRISPPVCSICCRSASQTPRKSTMPVDSTRNAATAGDVRLVRLGFFRD